MMNVNGSAAGVNQQEREGGAFPFVQGGGPIIEVSELDGAFNVYADFNMLAGRSGPPEVAIEFAQQGVVIICGTVQRYVPIPTDGKIEQTMVKNTGGIVIISVPTAGFGHRWRSILMW